MWQVTRSMRLVAIVGALLALFASSALADNGAQTTTLLLTPSGQPVGGWWQKWMNNSYMPTYQGSMVLDLNLTNTGCGSFGLGITAGCTGSSAFAPVDAAFQNLPETALNVTSLMGESHAGFMRDAKWELLYEQAHVIDAAYLTADDRAAFAAMWHQPVPTGMPVDEWWWYGEDEGGDPLSTVGEWFAYDYMICAVWPKLTWGILDWNGYNEWDGAAPIEMTGQRNLFPPLHDVRLYSYGPGGRVWVLPPTRHDSEVFVKQQRSCGMIRSWLAAGQAAAKAPS